MNSNKPQENKPTAAALPVVFNRYPYSDVESECKRILDWFDHELFLTTEDGLHKLKIAHLNERIHSLRKKGYAIHYKRDYVETSDGQFKDTAIYFLHRRLQAGNNVELGVRYLISRIPGFEKTDIGRMSLHEKYVLYHFLRKLE